MKKTAMILALAALGLASQAMAQQSPWQVRARIVNIDPADKSDPVGGVGAANQITVSNKTIPEVDISYFFTPNLAAELILTYPQKHKVYLSGTNIGTFKHLPPTLTLQYHFTPAAQISPYVGAGVNFTRIGSVKLLNGLGDLENNSFGFALQAGVDFKLDKNWSINLDVKKVQIRSDVFVSGAKVSTVKVDPVLVGVGLGYRF
ncbi:MAG TPA: OmpW family outer membrane protein [Noviherbaspirillum sp.]|uniref:OmpW/AlkL family protein n=1 Tax=Noviherbaspirillum sp. TaxID=1926288 RepID=UPI002D6A1033|nr:OmpW family outer membrane protein [Noviherbaspirillum sp.]HYD95546.1 OmpW family outer membrane protein [Noviherbaspirillum sp.]